MKHEVTHRKGDALIRPKEFSPKGNWIDYNVQIRDNKGRVTNHTLTAHKNLSKKDLRKRVDRLMDGMP